MTSSIIELEQLVEQRRGDRAVLRAISAELAHRSTERSHRLTTKIAAILDGLELPLAPVSPAGPLQPPPAIVVPPVRPTALDLRRRNLQNDPARAQSPPTYRNAILAIAATPTPVLALSKPATNTTVERSPKPEKPKMTETNTADSASQGISPLVSIRMLGLIDYVIAIEKAKLKRVTDVLQHGGFHRTHDELKSLPGVAFNRALGDGDTALLTVERLAPRAPPVPTDPVLKPWLVFSMTRPVRRSCANDCRPPTVLPPASPWLMGHRASTVLTSQQPPNWMQLWWTMPVAVGRNGLPAKRHAGPP